jgi:hypothetical protein
MRITLIDYLLKSADKKTCGLQMNVMLSFKTGFKTSKKYRIKAMNCLVADYILSMRFRRADYTNGLHITN